MPTPTKQRPRGKNYLGNTNSYEVHSLPLEKQNCQLDEIIRAGHAVTFEPDTQRQANAEGYDNCHYCLGASKR